MAKQAVTDYHSLKELIGTMLMIASEKVEKANQYGLLFKCFVERSYKSGHGKIINVSKDGLNDAYTFKTNQSSSLWDGQNQCKPAFYAVASIGANYNALDSLIAYTKTLQQGKYTPTSWSGFATALAAAKSAMSQNYLVSVSAADALNKAKSDLTTTISGLVLVVTADSEIRGSLPGSFALSQNYPNPFNPTTSIRYQIGATGSVTLKVVDVLGREVATLVNGVQSAGLYTARWDAATSPSGVYYYRLAAGNVTQTRKMVLAR